MDYNQIRLDDYNALLLAIPNELEYFKATQQITKNPRQAFLDLKDKNKYTNLDYKQTDTLLNSVKGVLISTEVTNLQR